MLKIYGENTERLDRLDDVCKTVCSVLGQRGALYAELTFVSARKMRAINRETRGVDAVTDVLSFPMLSGVMGRGITQKDFPFDYDPDRKAVFIGGIVICMQRVASQAKKYGHSEERETYYLIVHSLLHLFGYDHIEESDRIEMRDLEEKIMDKVGLIR